MRIAGSATFLPERARRRLASGVLLLVGGIASVGAASLLSGLAGESAVVASSLLSFVGVGGLLLGTLRLLSVGRDRDRIAGEGPVVAQLSAGLSDDYLYLRHVALPGAGVEADGILLGPHGALVLATRAVEGRFIVRGHDWFLQQPDGSERAWGRSPSWELMRPVRAVQRLVKEEGLRALPVHGAVVLVGGQLVEADLPGTAVVPLNRVVSYVEYLRGEEPAPAAELAALARRLEAHVDGARRGPPGPGSSRR